MGMLIEKQSRFYASIINLVKNGQKRFIQVSINLETIRGLKTVSDYFQ